VPVKGDFPEVTLEEVSLGRLVGDPSLWPQPGGFVQELGMCVLRPVDYFRVGRQIGIVAPVTRRPLAEGSILIYLVASHEITLASASESSVILTFEKG
jgi:hypothetical protein